MVIIGDEEMAAGVQVYSLQHRIKVVNGQKVIEQGSNHLFKFCLRIPSQIYEINQWIYHMAQSYVIFKADETCSSYSYEAGTHSQLPTVTSLILQWH